MSVFNIFSERSQVEIDELQAVFARGGITFSKNTAAKIVGGMYKLEKLVKNGQIRIEKPTAAQNGRWHCNAADVLRYIDY